MEPCGAQLFGSVTRKPPEGPVARSSGTKQRRTACLGAEPTKCSSEASTIAAAGYRKVRDAALLRKWSG
ncbi:hypothetical protein NDU88_000733 [Pleurodeles waltl]|uniref:Uncharacterized protein n=1 Tax=Pleurodeles waltl TaxID=8319 RepID=A0AAV7UUX2_PLEWA|nr:hypothetical protein NDU88_000733 [Pleurodeles waltl]